MKREARSEQYTGRTGASEDTGLGDIGRHWQASRLIAAREPAPAPSAKITPPKNG